MAKPYNMDVAVAKIIKAKPRKPRRAKSETDRWFDEMRKGYVQHGAEDLASARAKLGEKT